MLGVDAGVVVVVVVVVVAEEEEEEDLKFCSASCGFQHTLLVVAPPEDEPEIGGKCWAFGSQRYGQLGIIKKKEEEEVLLCDICNVLIAEYDCETCDFLEEQDRLVANQ